MNEIDFTFSIYNEKQSHWKWAQREVYHNNFVDNRQIVLLAWEECSRSICVANNP